MHPTVLRLILFFSFFVCLATLCATLLNSVPLVYFIYFYSIFIVSFLSDKFGVFNAGIEVLTEEANRGFVLLKTVQYRAVQTGLSTNVARKAIMEEAEGNIDQISAFGRVSIQSTRKLPAFKDVSRFSSTA